MTYAEIFTEFCKTQCRCRNDCEFVSCGTTFKCEYLNGVMEGFELGQKDLANDIITILSNYRKQHTKGDLSEYIESFCLGIKQIEL